MQANRRRVDSWAAVEVACPCPCSSVAAWTFDPVRFVTFAAEVAAVVVEMDPSCRAVDWD